MPTFLSVNLFKTSPACLRVRWLLVSWMFAVSAIAYIDRVNISIAGQVIAKEFHLSNIQLGWVFSSFVIGYALFQVPGGRLADWLGPRSVVMLGVIWWGIFTALITLLSFGTAALFPLLIGIRFSLGAGEAVVYPASNCLVADWIPSSERGVANGIIFSGAGLGPAITSPLLTYILLHHGWRLSFWASAALGLLAGAIWFVIARDSPRQHPWVSQGEAAFIEAGLPASITGATKLSWKAILRDRRIHVLTLSYFCYGYTSYIFFTWFFFYLISVRGLNTQDSSYYTMFAFLAIAIASLFGGWINDRLTRRHGKRVGRCGLATVAISACAILLLLGSQISNPQLACIVQASGVGSLYLSLSSFWSVSADIGGRSAGTVSGIMNMGNQVGGALTSLLTPAIANRFGWTASFLIATMVCGVGAAAWLFVDPELPRDGELES
jgi:MFS transporter, ACS family, glucarate transporter